MLARPILSTASAFLSLRCQTRCQTEQNWGNLRGPKTASESRIRGELTPPASGCGPGGRRFESGRSPFRKPRSSGVFCALTLMPTAAPTAGKTIQCLRGAVAASGFAQIGSTSGTTEAPALQDRCLTGVGLSMHARPERSPTTRMLSDERGTPDEHPDSPPAAIRAPRRARFRARGCRVRDRRQRGRGRQRDQSQPDRGEPRQQRRRDHGRFEELQRAVHPRRRSTPRRSRPPATTSAPISTSAPSGSRSRRSSTRRSTPIPSTRRPR